MALNGVLTRWELTPESKFKGLLRELQEYLKPKLAPVDMGFGDTYWTCGQEHYNPDPDCDLLANFRDFCKIKGYDWKEVSEMVEEYMGQYLYCECMIVNDIKGIYTTKEKIGMTQRGIKRWSHYLKEFREQGDKPAEYLKEIEDKVKSLEKELEELNRLDEAESQDLSQDSKGAC